MSMSMPMLINVNVDVNINVNANVNIDVNANVSGCSQYSVYNNDHCQFQFQLDSVFIKIYNKKVQNIIDELKTFLG